MATDKTYNGWTSYETWLINLWIDNDEGLQDYANELRGQYAEDYELSQALKEWFDEMQPEVTGVWADLINASLSEVNWFEIAQHITNEE
jgi:hypothetical protein